MSATKPKQDISRSVRALVFVLLASLALPSLVQAQPFPGPHKHGFKHHGPAPVYPRPGFRIHVLPRAYLTLQVGALTYFFLDGIFYRPDVNGYVVVPAPVGARVTTLPANATYFTHGDTIYYTYAGVYYQKVDGGYMVVAKPEGTLETVVQATTTVRDDPVIAREGDLVRVTATALNVRSGPGKKHDIVSQVRRGDLLRVQAANDHWYYVLLKDGTPGWVMIKYTTRVAAQPVG
ncbi:DUF6515 family protein [Desulfoplanes formicivorans]|uniref:SH3b domain-containing protein n=1 Tax=Desulfoplanes formicivorans TaxID=1592317 RepID=A0A194AMN9_9BACT|nr:DUF6515 family protein [Desulfoplanes formicivorans]GAU09889.1 hypothetical protein DPF_2625 [Desulfoplanes formicivorans]